MPSYAEALASKCEEMCARNIGYDQSNRWGADECDCSSLVYRCIYAIDPDTKLNRSDPRYTGTLRRDLRAIGFTEVPKPSHRRGDVLLNESHHVLVDLGGGRVGGARVDESGRASGGRGGDQTGREVCVHDYYDYPWDVVLRPPDIEMGEDEVTDNDIARIKTAVWTCDTGRQLVDRVERDTYMLKAMCGLTEEDNGDLKERFDKLAGNTVRRLERALYMLKGLCGIPQESTSRDAIETPMPVTLSDEDVQRIAKAVRDLM